MAKMWQGRTAGDTSQIADDFNSSVSFDSRMYKQDITGSMAHASMLAATGIIEQAEADTLLAGLQTILDDLQSGALAIDPTAEDIHMFVEQVLTERVGPVGKKLHTARSRNDQVALDLRLYLRDEIHAITDAVKKLVGVVLDKAEENYNVIMPGYTHLQRAQPITFGHHLMAYVNMLLRDISRLTDTERRMNLSPIGSCALAGTTYPTDRLMEAEILGFDGACQNSVDGVSDRDFAVELLGDIALLMMHLSRFSEEIILWCSWEFQFVELSDAFTTGSSIMPQKKNADMAELVRGKTARVYGNLMALLTMLKGLPLAYNKDMQEDKESVFDSCDTVKKCLEIFAGMVESMTVKPDKMMAAAQNGFINATDLADYLVCRGLPFRDAYHISGQIVAYCIKEHKVLETLPLSEYQSFSSLFDEKVFDAVDLAHCVERRRSFGGTAPESVMNQIRYARQLLNND